MTKKAPQMDEAFVARVLPMAVFSVELRARRYRRSKHVPIPVPLTPGETEAAYEAAFEAHIQSKAMTIEELACHPEKERQMRFEFARMREIEWRRAQPRNTDTGESSADEKEQRTNSSDAVVKHVIALDAFQHDIKSGKVAGCKRMSRADKIALFGVPYVPVFVPLAPGETEEEYEERFLEWLEAKENLSFTDLIRSSSVRQAKLRALFAARVAKGNQKYGQWKSQKRKRANTVEVSSRSEGQIEADMPMLKRAAVEQSQCCLRGLASGMLDETSLSTAMQMLEESGCSNCVLKMIKSMTAPVERRKQCCFSPLVAENISAKGHGDRERAWKLKTTNMLVARHEVVPELIRLTEESIPTTADDGTMPVMQDAVLNHLLAASDEINAAIVHNNGGTPTTRQIYDRNVVLASVIARVWRQNQEELRDIMSEGSTTGQVHLNATCYPEIAALSRQLDAKRRTAESLQAKLDDVLSREGSHASRAELRGVGTQLTRVDKEIAGLERQRRREFVTLLGSDTSLQQLVAIELRRTK